MTKEEKVLRFAEIVYSDFCELPGDAKFPLQVHWDHYEEFHGEIQNASLEESLVISAIAYGIACCVADGYFLEI